MPEVWGQNVNKASHRISEGSDLAVNRGVSLTPQRAVCVFRLMKTQQLGSYKCEVQVLS